MVLCASLWVYVDHVTLDKPAHSITATVLGAGTMGAGIAAHLAAAGCTVHLLDIVPPGSEGRPEGRSQIAQKALKALGQAKPPALMSAQVAERIFPGNLEDQLARAVGASDLVIEAVLERLDVKIALFQRVAQHAAPHTILATNTSGISIDAIAEALPADVQSRFLGLHFFNPPRWMYLLEVIPGAKTAPQVIAQASDFCDRALGKGIVLCRDTPNFIGNRIGIAEMLLTFAATEKYGLTIEQVDFLNGPLLGRPKTGSYRLGDLVGIDVVGHVIDNLKRGLNGDPGSPQFDPLYAHMVVPQVIARLIQDKRLGDKTGSGFYKKERGAAGQSTILSLDLTSFEYRARIEPSFPDLEQQLKLLELPARVGEVLRGSGPGSAFLRDVMLPLINYSAHLAGTICATAAEIDEAMKWGYGWQLGPFEILDAAGVAWVCDQLRAAGHDVAPLLRELEAQRASVYRKQGKQVDVFVQGRGFSPRALPRGVILLDRLGKDEIIHENRTARLLDLGDRVACLEFRSKANILDDGVVQLIAEAPQLLAGKGYVGMVLGNQAEHFCRGANLMHIAGLIGRKDFAGVEQAIQVLQDAYMNLRHGPIPVVAAPIGQTLGGGTEACLHCAEVQAGADLFMGLVEVGVGVLPAGGGLKEIARRASEWAARAPDQDPFPLIKQGFQAVATAKVSGSALEAKALGFLSPSDGITFNKRRVIADAKQRVLGLAARGWVPPHAGESISVIGAPGGANLMMAVQMFEWGGYASAYDKHIAQKVVHVLSGGMLATAGKITAQALLDLEREAFVSLCGEAKTFDRITHMLKTKKPLRN